MKKLLILLVLFLPLMLYAQQQIKGIVKDTEGQPLDGVTITLSLQNNNIAYVMADSGRFVINYKTSGSYILTATLMGYRSIKREVTLPRDSLNLSMQADSKQLTAVTISGTRPVIERKTDRVTFNVENSIVAGGGTAWEALSKVPGIQAKSDNSLSANKKSVQVYMDGKPLNLSGDDLASYLQGMPSNLVSKIEVFSNPPANFSADGGTAINIITKKTTGTGFNMTLNGGYTQATYGSDIISNTFNYRKDKLNIYGSYGYANSKYKKEQHEYVTYATPGNTSYWNSPGSSIIGSQSHNYRLGADYKLTDNQIIGVLVTGMNRTGNTLTTTPTTIISNNSSSPDSTLLTNGKTTSNAYRYAYNLNYNIKLDTNGKSLNMDVDYSPYHYAPNQYVNNLSFLPDGSLASAPYRIYTPTVQDINIYAGKMDYNYRAGKIWAMNSGVKFSSIQSHNNFDFYNLAGAQPELIAANSNHFAYTENTSAAYTTIAGTIEKWTFNAGLRAEFTHTRGLSETLNSVNTKQYFKLFPTVFITYKLNDNNELQASYSYRVDRPIYGMLNPAKHYLNPYNYLQGNPDLQPAFVKNIELGYTFRQQYNITAYYTDTHGIFSNITVQDNKNKLFYDTFQNLGLSVNTGLRFTTSFHLASWWEMNTMIEGYYQKEASDYLQGSYDYHKFSYDFNTTQSFTISSKLGLKAEVTAVYFAPAIQTIFKNGQNSSVNAGIKATILHGQGTIKLAAGDIFYGDVYRESVNYLNQNNGFLQRNDTRNGTLSFSYRLGKTVTAARKRNTADEEERKRAQ